MNPDERRRLLLPGSGVRRSRHQLSTPQQYPIIELLTVEGEHANTDEHGKNNHADQCSLHQHNQTSSHFTTMTDKFSDELILIAQPQHIDNIC